MNSNNWNHRISKEEYFFFEWLIIAKKIDTVEKYEQLSEAELHTFKKEYAAFQQNLR